MQNLPKRAGISCKKSNIISNHPPISLQYHQQSEWYKGKPQRVGKKKIHPHPELLIIWNIIRSTRPACGFVDVLATLKPVSHSCVLLSTHLAHCPGSNCKKTWDFTTTCKLRVRLPCFHGSLTRHGASRYHNPQTSGPIRLQFHWSAI